MFETKNQFARHGIFWFFFIPFVLLILTPGLMGQGKMRIHEDERAMLLQIRHNSDDVTEKTNQIFKSWFMDTGVLRATQDFVRPGRSVASASQGVRDSSAFGQDFVKKFWMMVYRSIWRIVGLTPLLIALLLAFVIPGIVDGLTSRAKMADTFGHSNPIFFWGAGHTAVGVMGIFFVLPLLPLPLSVLFLYGVIAITALSLWVMTRNFQTGV